VQTSNQQAGLAGKIAEPKEWRRPFRNVTTSPPLSERMTDAAWLPISCARCARVQLQLVQPGDVPTCRSCGAYSTVFPGATYLESDVPLFDRIEAAIRPLNISRGVAERVLQELRDVARRTNAPESVFLQIVDFLPPLHFLIPALRLEQPGPRERQVLTRATGMVLTIVSSRLRALETTPD
jgi:hypothetical protein